MWYFTVGTDGLLFSVSGNEASNTQIEGIKKMKKVNQETVQNYSNWLRAKRNKAPQIYYGAVTIYTYRWI